MSAQNQGDRQRWYWDLNKGRAVPASARGPGDNTLGPYDSKVEAENWRSRVTERNDTWDDADDEWENPKPSE